MPLELTPEEEIDMIENISKKITQRRLGLPALLFLEPYEPVSTLIGETILVWVSPFLDIFGMDGYKHSLLLRKKENIKKIRDSIEKKEKGKKMSKNLNLGGMY